MTADITFTITARSGKRGSGILEWNAKGLRGAAVSGPFKKGCLPIGEYVAHRSKLVDDCDPPGVTRNAFMDKKGKCWFQAIEPAVDVGRDGLGIHPDGNTTGTEGCIGLIEEDTSRWYNALRNVEGSIHVEVREDGSPTASLATGDGTAKLAAAIAAHQDEARYGATGDKTCCNLFVRAVVRAFVDEERPEFAGTANSQFAQLLKSSDWTAAGFGAAPAPARQKLFDGVVEHAARGGLVVAAYLNKAGSGHIAVIAPNGRSAQSGSWNMMVPFVGQAGPRNPRGRDDEQAKSVFAELELSWAFSAKKANNMELFSLRT